MPGVHNWIERPGTGVPDCVRHARAYLWESVSHLNVGRILDVT